MRQDDARPEPPERPLAEMCCGRGCVPCIYDYYEEALARYEVALREWQARQPEASGQSGSRSDLA